MEKVDFIIIESNGAHETLACPKCGRIFDIDAHTQENLIFCTKYMGYLSKCPDCGVVQKGEE